MDVLPDDGFLSLDSAKGEGLLDLAAFQQWRYSILHEAVSTTLEERKEERDKLYDGLRAEASDLYYQLYDIAQTLPTKNRVRLFRYLRGDTIDDIAMAESPSVTKQAVHVCLQLTIRDMPIDIKKARVLWEWGQTIYSSTVICSLT